MTYRLRQDDGWKERLVSLVAIETPCPSYFVSVHDLEPALEQFLDVVSNWPKESVAAYPHVLRRRTDDFPYCHGIDRRLWPSSILRHGKLGDDRGVEETDYVQLRGHGSFCLGSEPKLHVPLEWFLWEAFLLLCHRKRVDSIWQTSDSDECDPLTAERVGIDTAEERRAVLQKLLLG
jgi:hypothetical protein